MPMYRKSLLILVLLVLVVTGGAMYGYYGEDGSIELAAAEKPSEATDAPNASHAKIVVYVVGAVNRPGVVTLDANARAADAVNACGGVLPMADVEHVNMAQMLKDGQQLRIPEKAGTDAAQGEAQGKGAAEKGTSQIYFPTMGIGAGSVFYGVLVYAIQSSERKALVRARLFPYRKGILCALLAGILFFAGWRWSRPPEVMVAFIDVGQGDAMMVKTVHGHAVMFEKSFSFLMQKYGAETA